MVGCCSLFHPPRFSSRGLRAARKSAFSALLIGHSRAVECYVITARMLNVTCYLSKKNAITINGMIGQPSMDGYQDWMVQLT
jgi:hypothetical protein